MSDDLVKRLLDIAGDTNEENETIHEAADRIEKLELDVLEYGSAVADAQMRNEELDRALNRIIDRWEAQKARIEKLEAELHSCFHRIEELQTALREIAYTEPEDKYWPGRIARKALEGKDD